MFLDKEIAKKKFLPGRRLMNIFYFTRSVDRKRTTFYVGLIYFIVTFSNDFNLTMWLGVTTKSFVISNK